MREVLREAKEVASPDHMHIARNKTREKRIV
jgi:hypothetical protein